MGILGLLLTLVAVGLSFAVVWTNQSTFEQSVGTLTLMGYSAELTVAQLFMGGLVLGALGFFGLMLMLRGAGRRASRRAQTRRQLREQEAQLHELERQRDQAEARAGSASTSAAEKARHRAAAAEEQERLANR